MGDNYSTVSHTAINTTLSAAAGCVMTLFLSTVVAEHFTGEITFNLQYAMNGCLSGLVAITAGCSVVESWASIVIGLVAGALYLGFSKLLVKRRIDDAVDAIPVHVSVVVPHFLSLISVWEMTSPFPMPFSPNR